MGGSSDSAPAPEPDWEGMWSNTSRWMGEAGERHKAALERVGRAPGMSEEGRAKAIQDLESNYKREIGDIRSGSTFRQLQQRWRDAGAPGTMENWYTSQYGGYQSRGSSGGEGARAAAGRARQGPQFGASVGTDADIAGLGSSRPWWTL